MLDSIPQQDFRVPRINLDQAVSVEFNVRRMSTRPARQDSQNIHIMPLLCGVEFDTYTYQNKGQPANE